MPAGRPTKLTPDVIARLLQAIRLGATYEHACNYAGIRFQTLRNWIIRGEQAKSGKFFELFEAIKKAEGDALVGWLGKIEKAANDGDWQAAAWKAERRYWKEYGKKTALLVTQAAIEQEYNDLLREIGADTEAGGTESADEGAGKRTPSDHASKRK